MIKNPDPYTTILPLYNSKHPNLIHQLEEAKKVCINLEYEMVKRGYREANVYQLTPDNYDRQIEKIFRDKLVWLPINRVKKYNGYSHKHEFVENLSDDALVYGVIARDIETAEKFKKVQTSIDHIETAKLLGYPECCSLFFDKVFSQDMDPIWSSAINTEGNYIKNKILYVPHYNLLLLQHLRYFAPRIISWFPCSFLCEESSKKSKIWFSVLEDINPEIASFIKEVLTVKGQIWDLHLAQVNVDLPGYFRGIVSSYYTPERRFIKFGEEE